MNSKLLKIVGFVALALGVGLMLLGKTAAAKGVGTTPLLGELETWFTVGGGGALVAAWGQQLIPAILAKLGLSAAASGDVSEIASALAAYEANKTNQQLKQRLILAVLQLLKDEIATRSTVLAGLVNQIATAVVNEWFPATQQNQSQQNPQPGPSNPSAS